MRVILDNQVKIRALGWALIQYDWCPYKAKFGHRCSQETDDVKKHREKKAIYKSKREAWTHLPLQPSERTNPDDTLILDFQPPDCEE